MCIGRFRLILQKPLRVQERGITGGRCMGILGFIVHFTELEAGLAENLD